MSGDVAYLDTSAVVKLIEEESETAVLRRQLGKWRRHASSTLLRVELIRVIRRAQSSRLLADARRQLASISLIAVDDDLLDRAAELDPPTVRALDAIHLAAARSLADDLAGIYTYDERMSQAAEAIGLPVFAPR